MCKRWREAVGSCGKLWSSSSLQINSHNISPVLTLMCSGMLSRLRIVKVEKVTEQLLKAMVEHEGLEEVNFSGSDLSSVDPNLLASLVEQLDRVNLRKTRLTQNQMDVLFNRLVEGKTGLKELNLDKNDLSSILPGQLAGVVKGLDEFCVSKSRMTDTQQMIIAVNSLADETVLHLNTEWGSAKGQPAFLWCFNLVHNNPANLPVVTDILRRRDTLWRLQSLVVNNASSGSLTKELLELVIEYASIQKLDFSYSSLVQVEPELLATLVTQAVQANLSGTDLTKKQLKALLLRISQEETSLERLNLAENNLSSMEPSLLASSLNRLTLAGLSFCHLSTVQVEVLLVSMSQDLSCLEHLTLSDNYLLSVDPMLIGESIVNLKTANLCGTKLTLHQISVALTLIVQSTTLEYIALDFYQGLEYDDYREYQEYLNHQEYLDYKELIQEARTKMTVSEISKKQRKKEFFANGPRLLKLLNECCL